MNETGEVGSARVRTLLTRQLWIQALLVLLVCAAVYWPLLGRGGLAMSEGHRVVPAWEMLDSGDWLTPTMFEAVYVRKPPGMTWAIAASSMAFGETVWAARAVSALAATLMALGAWRVATSWFGSPWGLAAGLAMALSPQMWESGRSAEIEALNNLGTMVAALAVLGIVLGGARPARARMARALVLASGIAVMGLAKGPAGAPVVGAAVLAAGVLRWRALARAELWAGLAIGAAVVAAVYVLVWRSVEASGLASPVALHGTHLWRPGHELGVLALAPTAWAWALPASLALLFAWGPDARREGEQNADAGERRTFALGLSLAWVLSLMVCTAIGIANARYAAPAATLAPIVVAYVVRGVAGGFTPRRRAIGRAMLLGRAWVWAPVLLVGAWVFIGTREASVRATSGQEAGERIAELVAEAIDGGRIEAPATLLADGAIEARPEVLAEARRELERRGRGGDVRIVWTVGNWAKWTPDNGVLMLLRLDEASDEPALVGEAGAWDGAAELGRLDVHKYTLGLYLSAGAGARGGGG